MSSEQPEPISVKPKQIIIGLTGPFGSGCSTLAKVLERDYGFIVICLSDFVREEWRVIHKPKKLDDVNRATREELQTIGDNMRLKDGNSVLAIKAYSKLVDKLEKEKRIDPLKIVFDSIRNMGEVEYFRNIFSDFYLIALDCVESDRWARVQERYKGDYRAFIENDCRDKNEEGLSHGQQVALCVDDADVIIRNDNDLMLKSKMAQEQRLFEKMQNLIEMFGGNLQLPTEQETYMSMAYCASLMSRCFKRQVGAVIIDPTNRVVSVGYNDNPPPLKSCSKEFYDCYKEIHISEVMSEIKFCPECGAKIENLKYPYNCPYCKKNIYRKVVHDRALSRCSALHAEERAIINAGKQNLRDCTLYVTAFPCFLCTHKILEVGIKTIWYAEPYPDVDGLNVFERAKTVTLHKFEGVKARAYFRLFPHWRIQEEERMNKKRLR